MLRAGSAVTRQTNPYRAGLELGDALAGVGPDLVFVFGTGHYGQSTELVEGLYDAFDRPDLVVVGNAGDGFYSPHDVSDRGASALALKLDPATKLHVLTGTGVSADVRAAVSSVFDRVARTIEDPLSTFVFLQVDARANPVELERVLAREDRWPVVGGLVSDIHDLTKQVIFANRTRIVDGVVALVIEGPLPIAFRLANAFEYAGAPGVVREAEGTHLAAIEDERAVDFVERNTGQPLLLPTSAVAVVTILDDEPTNSVRVRGIVANYDDTARALTLYGKVEPGERVRAALADNDGMIANVRAVARELRDSDFRVGAALVLSCNGRRMSLGDRAPEEVRALVDGLGPIPLSGFPTFAEIAPVGGPLGTRGSAIHNMTYVLLVFGA